MSFDLRLEQGIVIGVCAGPLGIEDAKAGARAVWENPAWRGKPVLWDCRSARFEVGASEVRNLAGFILEGQPSAPPPRVAFVTARDVDFGMARMFEVFREHPATSIQVFRDYDKA